MMRYVISGGFCLAVATGFVAADSDPMSKAAPRVVVVEAEMTEAPSEPVVEKKSTAPRVEIVDVTPEPPFRSIDVVIPSSSSTPYNRSTDDHAPDGVSLAAVEPGAAKPLVTEAVAPYVPASRRNTTAWIEASYLRWRISDGPLPVPLVTAGSPTDAFPGALGQPGTRILFGGQNIDYRSADGIRIAAGFWLPGEPFGGEISIFSLERKQTSFTAASDPTGNPALYFPVINAATGGEASLVISDPLLGFAGDVSVTSQTRLCGLEVNGLFAAATCDWGQVDLIAGFRTLDLEESIVIRNRTTDLVFGTFTDLNDRFETENQFYGCQVGFRATGYCSKFFATVGGKVAGGWTRSVVDIQGFTTQTSPTPGVPNGQFAGGFYTQPSNIGSREELKWSWVPEVNCRVGCDLFGCVRAFVGYDWLYWCNVARPGNQIDRTVSLAQSPALGFTAPGPTIARPAAFHTTSDFFVHGFSAGIELHY